MSGAVHSRMLAAAKATCSDITQIDILWHPFLLKCKSGLPTWGACTCSNLCKTRCFEHQNWRQAAKQRIRSRLSHPPAASLKKLQLFKPFARVKRVPKCNKTCHAELNRQEAPEQSHEQFGDVCTLGRRAQRNSADILHKEAQPVQGHVQAAQADRLPAGRQVRHAGSGNYSGWSAGA